MKMVGKGISLHLPWSINSVSSITSSLSSLYCLFTIIIYVVITINKFVTNSLKNHAEIEVIRSKTNRKDNGRNKKIEEEKS